ncbi:hypothetical protein MRB53_041913 [Persea americana]|nr:hypothetical protein MRB53_041913 [Persea americana]
MRVSAAPRSRTSNRLTVSEVARKIDVISQSFNATTPRLRIRLLSVYVNDRRHVCTRRLTGDFPSLFYHVEDLQKDAQASAYSWSRVYLDCLRIELQRLLHNIGDERRQRSDVYHVALLYEASRHCDDRAVDVHGCARRWLCTVECTFFFAVQQ